MDTEFPFLSHGPTATGSPRSPGQGSTSPARPHREPRELSIPKGLSLLLSAIPTGPHSQTAPSHPKSRARAGKVPVTKHLGVPRAPGDTGVGEMGHWDG